MTKFLKSFANLFNNNISKKNNNFTGSFFQEPAKPKWTDREYKNLAEEAYIKNVIAHRAINLITQSSTSVPWKLYHIIKGKKLKVEHHPLIDLLNKPNPIYGGAEFFENIYAYKIISGNAYILCLNNDKNVPQELHILRPDRVTIVAGKNGMPTGYIYKTDTKEQLFPVDKITGQSQILHIRNFHPLDDWQGLSAIEAAAYSIDQHNQAGIWNQSLLQNGARPSGAMIVKVTENNGNLTTAQFDRLKSQIDERYVGAANAGRPLLLEGGLEWKEMSMSPKDMDFIDAKNSAARDIALAFGVPPQLLGIPGDATYSNMQEARLALWEETILPLLDHMSDALNNWLVPKYGNNLKISYDIDEISGLSARRERIWARIENSSFLTINEKRAMVGLSAIESGDKL